MKNKLFCPLSKLFTNLYFVEFIIEVFFGEAQKKNVHIQ